MPTDVPIACTLTAADMDKRRAELGALGAAALVAVEHHGERAVLRFRPSPGIRERLAAVVAAEAECCPFFDIALGNEEDLVLLTVRAPAGAEALLADLVAAFTRPSR